MDEDLTDDVRIKAMMLHYAGEAQAKENLTAYFTPRRNEEYEIFTFRQAQQEAGETLDQFHARPQQLAKNCNFQNKNREIKSHIVQKCLLPQNTR